MARELNLVWVHIEMDCQEMVRKLQSANDDLSTFGPMIKEVKNLVATREWKVTWVRRTANGAAHLLAKEGVASNRSMVWVHDPPECILQLLSAEIPAPYD